MASRTNATILAHRYSDALFALAQEKNVLEAIAAELAQLAASSSESATFQRLAESPILPAEDAQRAIDALAKQAKLSEITGNFLRVLVENRRLTLLPDIAKAFAEKNRASKGKVTAEITSAEKLTDQQKQQISDRLSQQLSAKVLIQEQVDKALIGGMIIKVGSRMMDASVKGRLERLSVYLKQQAA